MLDPVQLAQLPLSAFVLAAAIFLITWLVRTIGAHIERRRERTVFDQQFRYHVSFSSTWIKVLYDQTSYELRRQHKVLTAPPETVSTTDNAQQGAFADAVERIGSLILPPRRAPAKPKPADATDYVITEGFFDPSVVADKLLWLKDEKPGLALWLIETHQSIYACAAEVNRLNDEPRNARPLYNQMHLLRSMAGEYLLVAKAILDRDFRKELEKATDPESITDLLQRFYPFKDADPADVSSSSVSVAPTDDVRVPGPDTVDLTVGSKELYEVDESWKRSRNLYLIPGSLAFVFALMLLAQPIRSFFFPEPVSCKVTVDIGKQTQTLVCTYTETDLDAGLGKVTLPLTELEANPASSEATDQ